MIEPLIQKYLSEKNIEVYVYDYGDVFYLSENGVWLVEEVPVSYIEF